MDDSLLVTISDGVFQVWNVAQGKCITSTQDKEVCILISSHSNFSKRHGGVNFLLMAFYLPHILLAY
jgi:hypothetical protein